MTLQSFITQLNPLYPYLEGCVVWKTVPHHNLYSFLHNLSSFNFNDIYLVIPLWVCPYDHALW